MKTLSGFGLLLLMASALPAQNRSGFVRPGGVIRRGVPSVVQPGGTSAMPGIQRFTSNVVNPAGGSIAIGIPGTRLVRPNVRPNVDIDRFGRGDFDRFDRFGRRFDRDRHDRDRRFFPLWYGLGGFGAYEGLPEGPYVDPNAMYGAPPPEQPQQGNVTVIYPPQQQSPVVVYGGEGGGYAGPATRIFEPPPAQTTPAADEPEPERYLIAFKDRSIYAAVAYWVDGDTLHYFTTGNTHNQASVSLVDRELTAKLNLNTGREVKLPAAK